MTEQNKTVSTSSLLQENRTFPPSAEVVKRAYLNAEQYRQIYERSIQQPDAFWLEQARTLEWFKQPAMSRRNTWDTEARKIQDTWFEDGQLNLTVNCLDRHLKTAARTKTALIWQGEPENDAKTLTYEQLHREVCKFANVLKSLGVRKGDRVSNYLPMILELPIASRAGVDRCITCHRDEGKQPPVRSRDRALPATGYR